MKIYVKKPFRPDYRLGRKYQFKSAELQFELGHEVNVVKTNTNKLTSDPVLRFGKHIGKKLSETPQSYQTWLTNQTWWKG